MDAGGDERRAEVHGLLSRAALAVDRRRGRLDGQALLEPCVARDVEGLLAELRDTAGDDVFDLGWIDPGAAEDLGVGPAEQLRRVGVLVVALLPVPTPDRRANRLDDDDLAALLLSHSRDDPLAGEVDAAVMYLTPPHERETWHSGIGRDRLRARCFGGRARRGRALGAVDGIGRSGPRERREGVREDGRRRPVE